MSAPAMKRGARFGQWMVIRFAEGPRVPCRCSCGVQRDVTKCSLRTGNSRCCGCTSRVTHGRAHTPLHHIWRSMRHRCSGAAGRDAFYARNNIKVAKAWQKFEDFEAWALANGYRDGCSIARLHKDRGYIPSNCLVVEPGSRRPCLGRLGKTRPARKPA